MKKRLVSGITSTGSLTIGNYLGAIKNFVKLQEKYEMYIFIADLHALTIDISKENLKNNRKNIYALYLACGLDPNKVAIFFQSDIIEHAQLAWIMECSTTLGELKRMTQFKNKVNISKNPNGTSEIKTSLLTYPALMAADILLYNADAVPVGKDQKQHIELVRNIAKRFNNKYGQTFKIPKFLSAKVGSKIMALQEPKKKMSKSDKNTKNSIFLLDKPLKAFNKIKSAITDSEGKIYKSINKPGISNLLTIYSALKDISIKNAENHFKNKNYHEFKNEIGNDIKFLLENIQKKYKKYLKNIDIYAKVNAKKAKIIASHTINKVFKKIGLI